MRRLPEPPLLVITDRSRARVSLEETAEAAFAGGCRWLSLREKALARPDRLALLRRLAGIGGRYGALVGVHGDLRAALAVPGAALHLPAGGDVAAARRLLGPDRLIGLSAHGGDDLARSAADYVTVSPIHPSASKPGYGPALGETGLARAVAGSSVPVIALGGLAADNVAASLGAGAAGVAVMGGVMAAENPEEAVRRLLEVVRAYWARAR